MGDRTGILGVVFLGEKRRDEGNEEKQGKGGKSEGESTKKHRDITDKTGDITDKTRTF